MILLRTLGSLAIDGLPADAEQSILGGSRRVALLAYLAVTGRGAFIRRDTLLALFWPDADETHARGALRALLHQLRTHLGPELVLSRGDQAVAVEANTLICDVALFEAACDRDDWETARSLYRGHFLTGFGVTGAPDFEEWLTAERERLHGRAVELANRTAQQAHTLHDVDREMGALRQALSWSPCDERVAARLITALGQIGDGAGALQVFQQLEARLQAEFGVGPGAETLDALRRLHESRDAAKAPLLPAEKWAARAVARDATIETSAGTHPPRRLGILASLAVVAAVSILPAAEDRGHAVSDSQLIAVLPFAASSRDTASARLAQSLPLLLTARIQQGPRLRVPDFAATMQALEQHRVRDERISQRVARRTARQLGAARVLSGAAVLGSDRLVLDASLADVATGRMLAHATVDGRPDELDGLADRLLALLLARAAAEPEQRLPHLARVPIPALLWYLDGQARLRAHQPRDALDSFVRAIELDSSFATAALAASIAAGSGGTPWLRAGAELAWRWRSALAPIDRRIVEAKLGPRFPAPSSLAEQLASWEALVPAATGHAYEYEILFGYADHLFHYGALLGIPNALAQARRAFERATRLDASFPGAQQHLADLAFIERDTAALRVAAARLRERGDTGRSVLNATWMLAAATSDAPSLASLPRDWAPALVYNLAMQAGVRVQDAEHAASAWRNQASTLQETADDLRNLWMLALNRGQRQLATVLLDSIAEIGRSAAHLQHIGRAADRAAVLAAIYWEGDTIAAARHAAQLATRRGAVVPDDSSAVRELQHDGCVLAEWKLARSDTVGVRKLIPRVNEPGPALCRIVLRAYLAVVGGDAHARDALDALDALARTVPPGWLAWYVHGNLLIAALYERLGDTAAAYGAVRRRGVFYLSFNQYLSSYLRQEARLALAVADTPHAHKVKRHLAGLREESHPR
jgi:DNA-binding SARP family transcriptional activator/TolB-like protein